jgi:DNA-binding HxlR family transcriptional regulator
MSDGDSYVTASPAHLQAGSHELAALMLDEHAAWPADVACPVRNLLTRVGDTWTLLVILRLGSIGPQRFRELLRAVDGISQRMLTLTLRGLERDGLVERRVFATKPPTVEYRITSLCASLLDPVRGLAAWAIEHREAISQARRRFDADADNSGRAQVPPVDNAGVNNKTLSP